MLILVSKRNIISALYFYIKLSKPVYNLFLMPLTLKDIIFKPPLSSF